MTCLCFTSFPKSSHLTCRKCLIADMRSYDSQLFGENRDKNRLVFRITSQLNTKLMSKSMLN